MMLLGHSSANATCSAPWKATLIMYKMSLFVGLSIYATFVSQGVFLLGSNQTSALINYLFAFKGLYFFS